MARVGLDVLDADKSPEAQALRRELELQLESNGKASDAVSNGYFHYDELRARILFAQRDSLLEMRARGEIGDDTFHRVEERLDRAEVSVESASP